MKKDVTINGYTRKQIEAMDTDQKIAFRNTCKKIDAGKVDFQTKSVDWDTAFSDAVARFVESGNTEAYDWLIAKSSEKITLVDPKTNKQYSRSCKFDKFRKEYLTKFCGYRETSKAQTKTVDNRTFLSNFFADLMTMNAPA